MVRRLTLLALLAAVLIGFFVSLPPKPHSIDLPAEWSALAARTVAGAYHVHTTRSDGGGTRDVVAAAAKRAGLKFVILTDHGDGTRPPDPPVYLDDVLLIDAVEISTDDGHLVAIDMGRAPYPLGGAGSAVIEDVGRLGGFAIAAHPDSPKPALRWADTTSPLDGIEWLNADSEWRDETRGRLLRTGIGYLVRPAAALAQLLDRPVTLARWDRIAATRPVIALAAADAHGGIGQPAEGSIGVLGRVGIPSYEASFRTFSNRVVLDGPLSGDAARDARAVLSAIRRGRVFTTIDAVASPALLDFRRDGTTLVAAALAPAGAQTVLITGGREVVRTAGGALRWETGGGAGGYRIEVQVPGAPGQPPVPWIVSNELFLSPIEPPSRAGTLPSSGSRIAPFPWRFEKDPSSTAIVRSLPFEVELDYTLGPDRSASPFVALASDLTHASFRAVDFTFAADRPMRVSVQLRTPAGRWRRSVFVGPSPADARLELAAFRPIPGATGLPIPEEVTSLLLVIDLTNASPGSRGTLRVLNSALVK